MSTVVTTQAYSVDYTGRNPNNLIKNEQQVLAGVNGHDFYFIIPRFAPFFKTSLSITFKALTGEQRVLVEGKDYYVSHYFLGASKACSVPIYSSITFLDSTMIGTVTMSYQTLGGEWVKDPSTLTQVLADHVRNPRITTWEQVVALPNLFPVVDHEWNLVDMVGMSDVVKSILSLGDIVAATAAGIAQSHLNNVDNPHHVTAAQIGAVTTSQLTAAVQAAVTQAGGTNTDNLTEGTKNLFFTQDRVTNTPVGVLPNAQAVAVDKADTLPVALAKVQAQVTSNTQSIAKCAPSSNPVFTGMTAEHLETVNATTATTTLDLSKASAWLANINISTGFVFDVSNVKNATNAVIEFSLTTINIVAGAAFSWPSNVQWVDGVTPPRTTAINGQDEYYFYSINGGAKWTGSLSNLNVK